MSVQTVKGGVILAKKKKVIKNKNGNLTNLELVTMIHNGTLDEYMRKFKVTKSKCPPNSLIAITQTCFYCLECQRHCISQVKEFKGYYKIRNEKFMKADLEEEPNE